MNSANNSLFLGDLSKFCTEVELENLFSCCGQILDVKIKRNNNTGKTLSYGFVTFANEEIAANAMKMMDGTMFYGRKLRIRWAQYNARSQNPIHDSVINSVYVRFVTPKLDVFVTEEDLHNVFDKFGSVVDASIKESSIDKRTSRQSGYGFVHFSCDKAGVECAFQAVTALDNATINGVTYYVELSKNLLKQFNEMQQQGPMAGALHGPPDMGAPRSPMAGAGYAHNQHRGGGRPAGPQGDHFQNYPWAGGAHPSAYQQQQQAPHGYAAHPHHHHQQQQQQQQQFGQFHYGGGAATPQSEQEYYEEGFGHANPLPVLPAQQGYSPKTTHHFPPAAPAGGRPFRPQHVRGDGSFGSGDFGPLSAHSYSGSTSPLPMSLPHAVSPSGSHGSLTPTNGPPGIRWGGNSNNNSLHSGGGGDYRGTMEGAARLSGEEYFLQQANGMGAVRPAVPRLQINGSGEFGYGVLHNTPQARERSVPAPSQHQQFSPELLAQQLRPFEQAQGPYPGVGRSPMNRQQFGAPGGPLADPEQLMGPRSRGGSTVVPPLNFGGKAPVMSAYGGMVQKSLSMHQSEAAHRRTHSSEVNDVDSLTFEGLSITPNAFGSYVEISGEKYGASISPVPSGLMAPAPVAAAPAAAMEPLVLSSEGISGGDSSIEQGLVSQAIKLLSPPVTPRDYAVLLGTSFL